tara:strand:+ start:404 stop:607 length:204 start_codon:yes stop_codon:yes gene_type:complete
MFKLILVTLFAVAVTGCAYDTLEEHMFAMQKHYLSGGDIDEADTSVPEILQPPVLGPEENPDAEVTN